MPKPLDLITVAIVSVMIALSLPAKIQNLGQNTPVNARINPNVTQDMICDGNGGWSTDLVRPPSSVTGKIKKQMMDEIKTTLPPTQFQLDHIIPLTIGGAPLQPNLQLQPIAEARKKDQYEKQVWRQVCSGELTLKEAQTRAENWKRYYKDNKVGGYEVDEDDI